MKLTITIELLWKLLGTSANLRATEPQKARKIQWNKDCLAEDCQRSQAINVWETLFPCFDVHPTDAGSDEWELL